MSEGCAGRRVSHDPHRSTSSVRDEEEEEVPTVDNICVSLAKKKKNKVVRVGCVQRSANPAKLCRTKTS